MANGLWNIGQGQNMDDCTQEAILRCMQVPNITAVRPILTEKLTKMEKKTTRKSLDPDI